ncbi:MAG: type I restriction endonuclease subunit M [Betaproteobacteria bacterium]|nr:MAG: type I restriction endonuclease subunit M [Betaproteobacteria bacterium]
MITNAAKFSPGQIVATPGALALMQRTNTNPAILLNRHLHGDWGDTCAEDSSLNEQALDDGSRLMSVYRLVSLQTLTTTPLKKRTELPTVWIITEAVGEGGKRASSCILLPEDY